MGPGPGGPMGPGPGQQMMNMMPGKWLISNFIPKQRNFADFLSIFRAKDFNSCEFYSFLIKSFFGELILN